MTNYNWKRHSALLLLAVLNCQCKKPWLDFTVAPNCRARANIYIVMIRCVLTAVIFVVFVLLLSGKCCTYLSEQNSQHCGQHRDVANSKPWLAYIKLFFFFTSKRITEKKFNVSILEPKVHTCFEIHLKVKKSISIYWFFYWAKGTYTNVWKENKKVIFKVSSFTHTTFWSMGVKWRLTEF